MSVIIIYVLYYLLGRKYTKKRTRIFVIVLYSAILYLGFLSILNLAHEMGVTYTKNAENSSERQAVLLSMLNDDDFAEKQTTLGLSFVVLSTFPDNPIIGSGKLFQGKGYGGFISWEAGNVTDATLAIFLCEVGVIGLLIWLYIYHIIINKIGKGALLPKLIFFYLLIITIADPGLFFIGNVLSLFVSVSLCNGLNHNKKVFEI